MTCEKCGLAMRIVRAGVRPEMQAGGETGIWHVNEVACQNPRCAAKGVCREQKTLLWEGSALAETMEAALAPQLRAEVEAEVRDTFTAETKAALRAEVEEEVRHALAAEVRAELATKGKAEMEAEAAAQGCGELAAAAQEPGTLQALPGGKSGQSCPLELADDLCGALPMNDR